MKKSQAALEFFLSYGWVIMVVLVVIGALTNAGILNVEKLVAEECTAGIGLGCIDFRIDENSGTFVLINGLGQNIQLDSIEMGDCNAKNLGALNNGQKGAFSISGCENKPDEKISSNIKFRYITESGIIHTVEGKVIGIVEQGVTPVTGTFTWRAAKKSDFDQGTFIGTTSTPQNTVELAPGQSSGTYISKIYDAIVDSTQWNAIIIGMGGPYKIEVGKTNDDKNGAPIPFADTTGLGTLFHFNKETDKGETDTLVKDFSGSNNDATCSGNNCPAYDTGDKKLGAAAMEFDGNDDYLSHTQTNFNKEFTFSSWVKLDSLIGQAYYLKDFRDASNTKAPSFYYDVANTEFVIHDGTSKIATYDFTPPTNEWFQVAATMDFNNDVYKIYYNGQDVGAPTGGELRTTIQTSDSDFSSGTHSSTELTGSGSGASVQLLSNTGTTVNLIMKDIAKGVSMDGRFYSAVDSVDQNTAFIVYVDGPNLKLAKSTDGGQTWSASNIAALAGSEWQSYLSLHALDANNLFVAFTEAASPAALKFAKSTDGGQTWTVKTIDSSVSVWYNSIQASDTNNIFISYGDVTNRDLEFAKSNDGGNTWQKSTIESAGSMGYYNSISVVNANTIYITYEGDTKAKFAKSTNGGSSWTTSIISSQGGYTSLHALDANTLYAAISYPNLRFAKSTNGGNSWSTSTVHSSGNWPDGVALRALDANTIYIVAADYYPANYDIWFAKSTNGGQSWSNSQIVTEYTTSFPSMDAVGQNDIFVSYYDQSSYTGGRGIDFVKVGTVTYSATGTFTSSVIDIGTAKVDFTTLGWNANTPSGTSIKFQLAYSSDGSSWSGFIGPDGTGSSFFTSSGQSISDAFDGKRYIKYKAFLDTTNLTTTPMLNDISISYKLLPDVGTTGSTGTIGGRYALENGKRYSLDGLMDEVGIWNRDISAAEMLGLYKRGILKLTLSVRSCDDPNCSPESFTGSFNDATTYALLLEQNRYFQYKAEFETENTAYTPSLTKVEVDFKVS